MIYLTLHLYLPMKPTVPMGFTDFCKNKRLTLRKNNKMRGTSCKFAKTNVNSMKKINFAADFCKWSSFLYSPIAVMQAGFCFGEEIITSFFNCRRAHGALFCRPSDRTNGKNNVIFFRQHHQKYWNWQENNVIYRLLNIKHIQNSIKLFPSILAWGPWGLHGINRIGFLYLVCICLPVCVW